MGVGLTFHALVGSSVRSRIPVFQTLSQHAPPRFMQASQIWRSQYSKLSAAGGASSFGIWMILAIPPSTASLITGRGSKKSVDETARVGRSCQDRSRSSRYSPERTSVFTWGSFSPAPLARGKAHPKGDRRKPHPPPGLYQLDTLNSAFRLLVACYLAIKGSGKFDRLRVSG